MSYGNVNAGILIYICSARIGDPFPTSVMRVHLLSMMKLISQSKRGEVTWRHTNCSIIGHPFVFEGI